MVGNVFERNGIKPNNVNGVNCRITMPTKYDKIIKYRYVEFEQKLPMGPHLVKSVLQGPHFTK